MPERNNHTVRCRVIPKDILDIALKKYEENHTPSYGEIKYLLEGEFTEKQHDAGWRLEYFINDLFISCKEGLIDYSPNYESMISLFNQKTSPISSALSITFDVDE